MPASLVPAPAEGAAEPVLPTFCFGALLMRISDNGAVSTDVVSGWNRAINQDTGQANFLAAVRGSYPGWSVTRCMGQEIPPEEPAAPAPETMQ